MGGFAFPVYLFTKDDGSVMEFPTRTAMQGYLEAIDVENEEYEAWDATGRSLNLGVGEPGTEWLKITSAEHFASEHEFRAIKDRAEKWKEYESLWKRVHRWFPKS
jgi:hypothetical protein